jgi:hypothetical protein
MEPLLIVEPDREYRARDTEYLTSHRLQTFRECPLRHHQEVTGAIPPRPDTPAYFLGRAAHTMVLEGKDKFHREYAVGDGPINNRTGKPFGRDTKAFREWAEGQARPVVGTEDYAQLEAMAQMVRAHPFAAKLLMDGQAEGVVRESWIGCKCQSRIDWYGSLGILDYKTCEELKWFPRDASKYHYVFQMAFYRQMVQLALGEVAPVHFLVSEKKPPYPCAIWKVPEGLLDDAVEKCENDILRLMECREKGVWPTGWEEPRVIEKW